MKPPAIVARAALLTLPLLAVAACGGNGSTASGSGASNGSGGSESSTSTSTASTSSASSTSGGGSTTSNSSTSTSSSSSTSTSTSGASSSTSSSSTSSTSGSSSSGGFPPGTICNDTGTPRTPPAQIKHVIVVLEENKDQSEVGGQSAAPYFNSLTSACGYASAYNDNCFTDNLVSLPHYLALTSGSNCNTGLDQTGTGCITDDGDATAHTLSTASIFGQVSSWKAYAESMPSACDKSTSGEYAPKHNPPAYYTKLGNCSTNDVSIAAVTCNASSKNTPCTPAPNNAFTQDLANDTLPQFAFVSPNLLNDMHDGTVTQADNWLATYLPLIFQSKAYLRGDVVVMVLWDEQDTLSFGGATPNLFISPYITAGTVSTTPINHFAVLRAWENAFGISTYLGCASGMKPGGGTCPAGSTADVRAALNW